MFVIIISIMVIFPFQIFLVESFHNNRNNIKNNNKYLTFVLIQKNGRTSITKINLNDQLDKEKMKKLMYFKYHPFKWNSI